MSETFKIKKLCHFIVLPTKVVDIDIPKGDVQLKPAIHPDRRRPAVFEIPTTAIRNEASDGETPFSAAI